MRLRKFKHKLLLTAGAALLGSGTVVATPLIATGTFIGTGAKLEVTAPFVIPEDAYIFVWAEVQALVWRNRTSWHGRSQQFNAVSSSYVIGPGIGIVLHEPVQSNKFSVEVGYSVAARTYFYLIFSANGSTSIEGSSIVGNAVNPRTYDFTSRRSKLVAAKRDSARSLVLVVDGTTPFRADIAGTTNDATGLIAVTNTGVTLNDSVWVNENNNAALGEGIEYLSLAESSSVSVTRAVGTGGATTRTGMGKAVLVFDTTRESGTGWEKPQIVIDGQSGQCFDGVAPGAPISLAAGTLTLPAAYNANTATYAIISLNGTATAATAVDAEPLSGFAGKVHGHATLAASVAMSGACSYEYWGKPMSELSSSFDMPLLMFGDGADLATSGMNGGIYLYSVDPDGGGWRGGVLRIIHSIYYARPRTAPHASINYYNLNTGVIIPLGRAIHVVVTHNGTGHWRAWLNGNLIKDYKVDLNQVTYGNRTNGGEGIADIVSVNSHNAAGTLTRRCGEIYRAQQWASQLTDAQAASLFSNAKNGTTFSGAAPTNSWDFRLSLPGGTAGILLGDRTIGRLRFPIFTKGSVATTAATPVQQTNSDVIATTDAGATNGRCYAPLVIGAAYRLVTKLDPGAATRIICRTSDTAGATGTAIFDITGSALIDRTDTFTPGGAENSLHYIGITTAGQAFTIKAGTELYATTVP